MGPPSRRVFDTACIALAALALTTASARADVDPKHDAQVLVTRGVHLLEQKQYEQALDRFTTAYQKFPNAKILLNIGSTQRDMGRIADAANTYAHYLDDPDASADRVTEVTQLLRDLDRRLAVLVIDISPTGADVSIDGGAWIPVGGRMSMRVLTGAHVVRARKVGLVSGEQQVTGRAGGRNEISLALQPIGPLANRVRPGDVRVAMDTGPAAPVDDRVTLVAGDRGAPIPLGLSVESRIDGELRGAAYAVGILYDPSPVLETELAALVSDDANGVIPGAYVGARLRGGHRVRPFLGGGVPVFWSGGKARVGLRGGGGLELGITAHLSLLVDVGFEHFFNSQSPYDATLFVPIVGVQGHL